MPADDGVAPNVDDRPLPDVSVLLPDGPCSLPKSADSLSAAVAVDPAVEDLAAGMPLLLKLRTADRCLLACVSDAACMQHIVYQQQSCSTNT